MQTATGEEVRHNGGTRERGADDPWASINPVQPSRIMYHSPPALFHLRHCMGRADMRPIHSSRQPILLAADNISSPNRTAIHARMGVSTHQELFVPMDTTKPARRQLGEPLAGGFNIQWSLVRPLWGVVPWDIDATTKTAR